MWQRKWSDGHQIQFVFLLLAALFPRKKRLSLFLIHRYRPKWKTRSLQITSEDGEKTITNEIEIDSNGSISEFLFLIFASGFVSLTERFLLRWFPLCKGRWPKIICVCLCVKEREGSMCKHERSSHSRKCLIRKNCVEVFRFFFALSLSLPLCLPRKHSKNNNELH